KHHRTHGGLVVLDGEVPVSGSSLSKVGHFATNPHHWHMLIEQLTDAAVQLCHCPHDRRSRFLIMHHILYFCFAPNHFSTDSYPQLSCVCQIDAKTIASVQHLMRNFMEIQ